MEAFSLHGRVCPHSLTAFSRLCFCFPEWKVEGEAEASTLRRYHPCFSKSGKGLKEIVILVISAPIYISLVVRIYCKTLINNWFTSYFLGVTGWCEVRRLMRILKILFHVMVTNIVHVFPRLLRHGSIAVYISSVDCTSPARSVPVYEVTHHHWMKGACFLLLTSHLVIVIQ